MFSVSTFLRSVTYDDDTEIDSPFQRNQTNQTAPARHHSYVCDDIGSFEIDRGSSGLGEDDRE